MQQSNRPTAMRVVSVNTGLPRTVRWQGRDVTTGIFKEPRHGRVAVARLNLDGDGQADLTVHGGPNKAVYAYPLEYYEYWRTMLPGQSLPLGVFGENLTVSGISEDSVHLGDEFTVGSVHLVVTQPRPPCYKLGVRFQSDQMVKRFLASGKSGFYLAVIREGDVGTGDEFIPVLPHPAAVPVADITRLYVAKTYGAEDIAAAKRAMTVAALPDSWKEYLEDRLQRAGE